MSDYEKARDAASIKYCKNYVFLEGADWAREYTANECREHIAKLESQLAKSIELLKNHVPTMDKAEANISELEEKLAKAKNYLKLTCSCSQYLTSKKQVKCSACRALKELEK